MNEIRTTQANPAPDFINFGIGQPSPDLLPLEIVREATAIRLGEGDASLLNYGYEQGDGYFRLELARFLQRSTHIPVTDDSLMVTAGASQALDLICTRFTKPGDIVFVEEPTYFLALRIFADHHLQVVGLPIDEDGLIIEQLVSALKEQHPAILYTVPTFQNPSGVTLSQAKRQRLIELSEQYDFLVVADEVYHLLDYGLAPPPPLASFSDSGHVLSIGSFSKILGPGLRLGWIQAAASLLQGLISSGLLDSGGGLNPFTSNLIRIVLERGWQDEHLVRLKAVYKSREETMGAALDHHLSDYASYAAPNGGFFFWLALPEKLDTLDFLAEAREYQVGFQPGARFSSNQALRNYVRLSFAYYHDSEIQKGIERLAKAIAGFSPGHIRL
jgi:DNA-binding transcriptional MocR family regulator